MIFARGLNSSGNSASMQLYETNAIASSGAPLYRLLQNGEAIFNNHEWQAGVYFFRSTSSLSDSSTQIANSETTDKKLAYWVRYES